jgi:hypothetical protein
VPTREGYLRVCVDGPVFALDLLGSGVDQTGGGADERGTDASTDAGARGAGLAPDGAKPQVTQ